VRSDCSVAGTCIMSAFSPGLYCSRFAYCGISLDPAHCLACTHPLLLSGFKLWLPSCARLAQCLCRHMHVCALSAWCVMLGPGPSPIRKCSGTWSKPVRTRCHALFHRRYAVVDGSEASATAFCPVRADGCGSCPSMTDTRMLSQKELSAGRLVRHKCS
jgi:hypothetical protein